MHKENLTFFALKVAIYCAYSKMPQPNKLVRETFALH